MLQIERLATVSFDNALSEMIRYHRFLLALYASRTPDGAAFNYAELTGDSWDAPHLEWIRQYSRLFSRAMDRLPDDDRFIRSLAYTPSKLLLDHKLSELSPNVVKNILDLAAILINRIQAWVTKRTTVTVSEGQAAAPRLALSGSDAKSYASVLHEIVGAWERTLQHVSLIYNWPTSGESDAPKAWSAFRASWPFLWQHLSNTAYCLASSVWNEDEIASTLFRESLLRWRYSLSYRLDESIDLKWRRLLFPDIMNLDWSQASRHASKLTYDYMPSPSPSRLFSAVLDGAHDDVVLLTAALLLFWSVEGKQSGEIGGRTAASLLHGEGAEEHDHRARRRLNFRSIFLDILRYDFAEASGMYAGELNNLVRTLDNMTERRVVPGRVYSPSTLHDRDGLSQSFVAMLAASVPHDADRSLLDRVTELAKQEDVLPGGDRSLRNVIRQLEHMNAFLDQPPTKLNRGISLLASEQRPETSVEQLRGLLSATRSIIEDIRLERIRTRPIDHKKVERIRSDIEFALFNEPFEVPFFRNVKTVPASENDAVEPREVTFKGLSRTQWIEPQMESQSPDFDQIVERFRDLAGRRAWHSFQQRARTPFATRTGLETAQFWNEIAPLVSQIGSNPILVLSQKAEARIIRTIMRAPANERPPLRIEHHPIATSGASYLGTLDRVDLFAADFSPGVAWLFSARALVEVRLGKVDRSDNFVTVNFDTVEPTTGTLRIQICEHFEWADDPIFEIRFPAQAQPRQEN
ncbi:hypothetical protein [Bradyrhizobium sp. USDA 4354]